MDRRQTGSGRRAGGSGRRRAVVQFDHLRVIGARVVRQSMIGGRRRRSAAAAASADTGSVSAIGAHFLSVVVVDFADAVFVVFMRRPVLIRSEEAFGLHGTMATFSV